LTFTPNDFGNVTGSNYSVETKVADREGIITNGREPEVASSPLKARRESSLSLAYVFDTPEKSQSISNSSVHRITSITPVQFPQIQKPSESPQPESDREIPSRVDQLSQKHLENIDGYPESTQQSEHERLFDSEMQEDKEDPEEWIEVQLDSILSLRSRLIEHEHPGLTEILQEHTFVGKYNERLALIQHKTSLLLVDYKEISKQMWYQFLLHGFSNFGVYFFDRISIQEAIKTHLQNSDEIEADEKGKYGQGVLVDNRMMLKEYFSIIIDKDGHLVGIPMMIQEYSPNMIKIPTFLYDLSTKVEWLTELECFESVSRVIADFYSVEEFGDDDILGGVIFPLFRKVMAKDGWVEEGVVKQVANLEDLYKIFERC
jgi:DNA mismatch repair protein MLH1